MAAAFSKGGALSSSLEDDSIRTAIETLKRRWHQESRLRPFYASLSIIESGLVLGPQILLAPMIRGQYAGSHLAIDGDEEQILALLSLGFQKRVSVQAPNFIKRAAMQWEWGDKIMAHLELAYARLPRFETRDAAWLLFCADGLIAKGFSPRWLMDAVGIDTQELDLLKYAYDPNQLRIPAGNGRPSGEWVSGEQYAQNPPRVFPQKLPYVGGRGGGGGAGPGSVSPEGDLAGESAAPAQINPSSRALGRALEETGEGRPANAAAHHVVAGSAPDAQAARAILDKYNIGINDAENGVFLPAQAHSGIHTSRYYDAVNRALSNAGSREETIRILNSIKESAKAGRFPE